MSSQRLLGILMLAIFALAGTVRESRGAQLVVGQDYHSVQLLSGTSAAVLQGSLALVADQPYARIERQGSEFVLRVGFWENRGEAMPVARALLPKFRGAHTRIVLYHPEAIVASAGEQLSRDSMPSPATGARAPQAAAERETVQAGAQAEREMATLSAERVVVQRRAEAAEKERIAADARLLSERQQAAAQAEAAQRERERVAAEREATAQAALREKAEVEALQLAESRRDAERRAEAVAKERIEAEARALREASIRQQAEAQAEAAARERVAAERDATAQALLREKAEAEALRLAEMRRDAEQRAAAVALERSAAEERIAKEAAARAQAQREAERLAQEKSAEQQRLIEQAQARERAEAEALKLAESRGAPERPTAEVTPLRTEPVQSQVQTPDLPAGSPLLVGQDYHSVQLLSGTSAAVLQESLALVAGEPYARIDKRGAGYALRVGYWDTRAAAVQAAKALSPKFRGAHARIATYRPDAIVARGREQPSRATVPVPSAPEVPPLEVARAAEQPFQATAPIASTPEIPPLGVAAAVEQPSRPSAPVATMPEKSPPRTEPAQMQAQAPASRREPQPGIPEAGRQAEYQLGAGDAIKIFVFQNPDLTVEARVTENGTISFPLIGEVKVGGMTISAAEQTIAKALKDGGFIQQPQVNIVLGLIRGSQVAVLGQVNRPGRFPLETTNIRVSEMIATAGGITVTTGADVAVLTGTREGKPFRKEIDIASLFVDNNLQDDIVVANGDVIFVQRAPMFYIYGEVQRPGSYRVERNMTVRQALAQGGGPTIRGTERSLRLHRRSADGKVEVLRPDMGDPVRPEDVIYVRESIF